MKRAASALAALGCGWMDVQGPTSVAAPSQLRAGAWVEGASLGLEVSVTPPPGALECALEVDDGTGHWHEVQRFSPDAAQPLRVPADPALDGREFVFRVRCQVGALVSPPSEEVRLRLPLLAATQVNVIAAPHGVHTVTWNRTSRGADRLELQRRLVPAAGEPGPWQTLSLSDVAATRYSEIVLAGWEDGARFAYRVVYHAGAQASAPVEGLGPPGRPLPLAVTATAGAGGFTSPGPIPASRPSR